MQIIVCRNGESLRIDDTIHITVIGISRAQVKLGLKAPPDVMFYRQEVYQRTDNLEEKDNDVEGPSVEPDPPR